MLVTPQILLLNVITIHGNNDFTQKDKMKSLNTTMERGYCCIMQKLGILLKTSQVHGMLIRKQFDTYNNA